MSSSDFKPAESDRPHSHDLRTCVEQFTITLHCLLRPRHRSVAAACELPGSRYFRGIRRCCCANLATDQECTTVPHVRKPCRRTATSAPGSTRFRTAIFWRLRTANIVAHSLAALVWSPDTARCRKPETFLDPSRWQSKPAYDLDLSTWPRFWDQHTLRCRVVHRRRLGWVAGHLLRRLYAIRGLPM